MKIKRKKLRHSNKGFTLVELLVTMLISSIVTMAVAGFLSMGLQYYNRANAETTLQTESQVAELFLTELLQESQDYNYKKVTSGSYPEVESLLEVKRDDNVYVIVQNGKVLWFAKLDDPTIEDDEKIAFVLNKKYENAFLAKHVETFFVSPSARQTAIDERNGLVNLGLSFSIDKKNYTGDATVALRNTKRN